MHNGHMAGIGTRIRRAREAKHLLQHDLADRLRRRGYGTTQATISRWEKGQMPRGYVIRALADELDTTVADLLGENDDDEEPSSMSDYEMFRELVRRIARDEVKASL